MMRLISSEVEIVSNRTNPLPTENTEKEKLTLSAYCAGHEYFTAKQEPNWAGAEGNQTTGFVKYIVPYNEKVKLATLFVDVSGEPASLGQIDLTTAIRR